MAIKIIQCSDGHLFIASTAKLIFFSAFFPPGMLLVCPVDHKWRRASVAPASALSESEIDEAQQHRF